MNQYSILKISELMILKHVTKFRIEANPSRTKFGCTIDYYPTFFGSTIEQACSKAVAALEKKLTMKDASPQGNFKESVGS